MDKTLVLEAIIARLQADMALYAGAANAARAEATDEQSRPENKYDTRGLEASYLARGQSRQARETETALEQFGALAAALRPAAPGAGIAVGMLLKLQTGRETTHYFLGPRAGGTEVTVGAQDVVVLTLQSPLGKQLVGHRAGETLTLDWGGTARATKIVSVQ